MTPNAQRQGGRHLFGADRRSVLLAGLVTAALVLPIAACRAEEGPRPAAPPLADLPVLDLPMTVEEAYAAVPHQRTEFDFGQSSLDEGEARYLAAAFHLIEQGIRARVVGLRDLAHRGSTSHSPAARLGELRAALAAITPPDDLEAYHAALLVAFDRQRAVFEAWQAAGADYPYRQRVGDSADVRAASQALQRAYGELMRLFGAQESPGNQQAFFDYHCALDFL